MADIKDVTIDGVNYNFKDAKAREDVSDLKEDLSDVAGEYLSIDEYLYKHNIYINNNGVETTLNGFSVYKVPVSEGDVIAITQPPNTLPFIENLNASYAFKYYNTDGTYTVLNSRSSQSSYYIYYGTYNTALFIIPSGVTHLVVTVYDERIDYVQINKNKGMRTIKGDAVSLYDTVIPINDETSLYSSVFRREVDQLLIPLTLPGYANALRINKGDKVVCDALPTGFSYYGTFTTDEFVTSSIASPTFTAPEDGIVFAFNHADTKVNWNYYPANSIKIDYENIENIPPFDTGNPYNNMTGVAFGTSLTYRALTTGGFLQYLEPLSGMTFDNQGLGSSTILPVSGMPQMMPKITGYTGYSDKDVCLLEGFVNDWYYNGDKLGTWKDDGQTTVCGCIRYAINYIWTQNPDLTIFLILDHYGKGISASTAVNEEGQTQYEWWAEIEKVALSMGVRVIREYEISEINENTHQYLLDNIHLNALGAEQSANAIWSVMKQSVPNI